MVGRSGKTVIARIGGLFSYSDIAGKGMFGEADLKSNIVFKRYSTFNDCLDAVNRKKADYAVVPVRNKIIGDIRIKSEGVTVKQKAARMKLKQTHKHKLEIHHVLASHGRLKDVKAVYSKREALDQCMKFLNKHRLKAYSSLPGGIPILDTSDAAKRVAGLQIKHYAAICGSKAALHFKLPILTDNIADVKNNFTMFYAYALRAKSTY